MCNVTFQTFILLMNTIVTKSKIQKNQNVDISSIYYSCVDRLAKLDFKDLIFVLFRYRNDVPAPFVGYTATRSTHPPGQPGLPETHAPRTGLSKIYSPRAGQSNIYSPPAGQNTPDLVDVHGIVNTEFRDDEGCRFLRIKLISRLTVIFSNHYIFAS